MTQMPRNPMNTTPAPAPVPPEPDGIQLALKIEGVRKRLEQNREESHRLNQRLAGLQGRMRQLIEYHGRNLPPDTQFSDGQHAYRVGTRGSLDVTPLRSLAGLRAPGEGEGEGEGGPHASDRDKLITNGPVS